MRVQIRVKSLWLLSLFVVGFVWEIKTKVDSTGVEIYRDDVEWMLTTILLVDDTREFYKNLQINCK